MPKKYTHQQMIDRFQQVLGISTYDYSKVKYNNMKEKVCGLSNSRGLLDTSK